MAVELPIDIEQVKGFLAEDEAEALFNAALELSPMAKPTRRYNRLG